MDNDEFLSRMQQDFSDYGDDDLELSGDADSFDSIGQDSVELSDEFSDFTEDISDDLIDVLPPDDSADALIPDDTGILPSDSDAGSQGILAGVSVSLDFDMEDLSSDFSEASTEIATINDDGAVDTALLHKLLDECTQLGFVVNDGRDLDHVKNVHEYAIRCTRKDNLAEFYQRYYPDMLNSLASSSSLYVTQESNIKQFKAKILKCLNDRELQGAGGMAINIIYEQLLHLRQTKDITTIESHDIDANAVWKELVTNRRIVSPYLLTHESTIRNFIITATNALIENEISSVLNNQADESRRIAMSYMLTEDVHEVVQALQEHDSVYIKSIEASDGGDVHCVCAECGKKVPVRALMHFVFFQHSGKTQPNVYPANNKCSCGRILVFPAVYYAKSLQYYLDSNGKSLRETLERTKNFSRGSATVMVTPSLAQLPPEITCIVSDNGDNSGWDETVARESIQVFDSNEWLRAVNEFYARIDMLNGYESVKTAGIEKLSVQNDDSVSDTETNITAECSYDSISIPTMPVSDSPYISVLAANVAQVAGVNYNTVKGKALLSLINFLHENSIVDFYMNFDNVISANAALRLADSYSDNDGFDLNRLDRNVFDNLMMIAASLDPEVQTPQDRNDIKKFFTDHYDELRDKVVCTNDAYTEFVNELWVSRYSLAMLPITDYRQSTIYSIIHFLVNDSIFQVIDEICDRMVINNYASKYFEYWSRDNMPHVKNFKKKLNQFTDVVSIQNTMRDIFKDVFTRYGVAPSECYFDNVTIQSMGSWNLLRVLSDTAESGNYYRFCREAQKIRDAKYGFGFAFDNALRDFRNSNYDEFVKTTQMSEVEFYLGTMFTKEELEAGTDSLEFVVFGRYIPVRRDGETIEKYAERFRMADVGECFDNMERFKNLKGFSYVHFGSALTRAKQDNFRIASYVAGMMDSVINSRTADALGLVGVSELRYSMLVQRTRLWKFDDFNINNADVVTLLNSYYFTDAGDALVETFSKMCNSYFTVAADVTPFREIFNFDECLLENLKDIASNPDGMDLSSMVEEMRGWEYTKRYVERFVDG